MNIRSINIINTQNSISCNKNLNSALCANKNKSDINNVAVSFVGNNYNADLRPVETLNPVQRAQYILSKADEIKFDTSALKKVAKKHYFKNIDFFEKYVEDCILKFHSNTGFSIKTDAGNTLYFKKKNLLSINENAHLLINEISPDGRPVRKSEFEYSDKFQTLVKAHIEEYGKNDELNVLDFDSKTNNMTIKIGKKTLSKDVEFVSDYFEISNGEIRQYSKDYLAVSNPGRILNSEDKKFEASKCYTFEKGRLTDCYINWEQYNTKNNNEDAVKVYAKERYCFDDDEVLKLYMYKPSCILRMFEKSDKKENNIYIKNLFAFNNKNEFDFYLDYNVDKDRNVNYKSVQNFMI